MTATTMRLSPLIPPLLQLYVSRCAANEPSASRSCCGRRNEVAARTASHSVRMPSPEPEPRLYAWRSHVPGLLQLWRPVRLLPGSLVRGARCVPGRGCSRLEAGNWELEPVPERRVRCFHRDAITPHRNEVRNTPRPSTLPGSFTIMSTSCTLSHSC